jgi:hypothetical protein
MSRATVKLIHADDFFSEEDAKNIFFTIASANFVDKEYGKEINNFNLIQPGIDKVFSYIVGEPLIIDEEKSGVFRRPMNCQIHFESYEKPDEWCFVVALERSTFNVFQHKSGAKTALDGYQFNYKNLFEWDYTTNILLERNQCLFYRPWLFHSMEDGLVQYYKLLRKDENAEHIDITID